MNNRYASRKFLLTVVSLSTTWVAFALSHLTEPSAVHLTTWVLGLYFAGNVGTKAAEGLQTKP